MSYPLAQSDLRAGILQNTHFIRPKTRQPPTSMRSAKLISVPRAATPPAPQISFTLRSRLLFPLLALLGFFVGEMHATPLLYGSYFTDVSAYLNAGVINDSKMVTNQPIASQTTSFSAVIAPGLISAGSALTLNILNDDGSGHARISANTAGNYFRPDGGPSLEADASFGLSFSVSEAVVYSITGSFLFDLEDPTPGHGLLQGSWETQLHSPTSSSDLYSEREGVQGEGASAMHLNLVDEGTTVYTGVGSLTGTLLPGQFYSLYHLASLFGGNGAGTNSGVSSSTFSIDFVKATDTGPIDPPPANSVPDAAPTEALLGLGLLGLGLVRRQTRTKPDQLRAEATVCGC